VVDGHTAFIGGLNIAGVHVSVAAGGAGWHDMHARVCGPAAQQLEQLFAGTWRRATKKRVMPRRHLVPDRGTTVVEILESRFGRNRSIQRAYIAAVHRARQRISICSAYFIPDRAFVRALVAARQRGVAVNLLLAGVSDVVPVQFASRALYKKLLSSGVLIYEWPKRVLHAKTIVTDGNWCSIGSYNMDRRSLLYNLEVNIACEDTAFAHAMEAQFDADRRVAAPVLLSVWHRRRALQKFLEQLFYLLRFWL
jgi:cardiolipin synthase